MARLASGARDAMLNTLNTSIGPNGKMMGYVGAMPASPEIAPAGLLLFTLTLALTALGAASGGTVAFNAITSAPAAASGIVGFVRVAKSDGTGVMDIPASELIFPAGSGGELAVGTTITASTFTASLPLG